jgi:hypothetical protein
MQITLAVKRNYGTEHIYPVCDTAAKLTALTGKRTLSHADIKTIRALGYTITVQQPEIKL